VNHQRGVFCRM
jgi:hypothetical protein